MDRFQVRLEDWTTVSSYKLIILNGQKLESKEISQDRITIDASIYTTGPYILIFYDAYGQVVAQRTLVKM